jgi:hypothetical protein
VKTTVGLMLAIEYDPDEKDSIQKSFGVTENELLALMMKIGRLTKEASDKAEDDEEGAGVFAQDILMEMIKGHELTDNMILYLACYGLSKLFETFADGIYLVLDAEEETKKVAEQ